MNVKEWHVFSVSVKYVISIHFYSKKNELKHVYIKSSLPGLTFFPNNIAGALLIDLSTSISNRRK